MHQLITHFDPTCLNLNIGLITTFSQPIWGWFINRLGKVQWTLTVDRLDPQLGVKLLPLLEKGAPHIIFVDECIRLRPNNPIWKQREIQAVICAEEWRGKPPNDWWICQSRSLSHEMLGGVTNGLFQVHLATSIGLGKEVGCKTSSTIPAKLKSILDYTSHGSRCPVPLEGTPPMGQDAKGLLHWKRRFGIIEAPSVYSNDHWVKRRLTDKELCAVFDLPRKSLNMNAERDFFHYVNLPGKARARVVEDLRFTFNDTKRKRGKHMSSPDPLRTAKKQRTEIAGLDPVEPSSKKEELLPLTTVIVKSTKADDASVPIHLWDDRCLSLPEFRAIPRLQAVEALAVLRNQFLLPFWKRKVARSFWSWLTHQDSVGWWRSDTERNSTIEAGLKAIAYSAKASWWDWDGGSFPFFWRWEKEFIREVRDGIPPRFFEDPPSCRDIQKPNPNPIFAGKERSKVFKVVKRGYLKLVEKDQTKSLMHYFSVPKGEDDIRMVYDGSKCGLNAVTFAPWFSIPTSNSLERTVLPHTYQGDNDFGDMFLNFQLHKEMQKYSGVDGSDLLRDADAAQWFKEKGYDTS